MTPKELVDNYPEANQVAKKEGITKEQAQEQQQMKRQDAESQVIMTGNDNLDKAQQQLAKLVGPNRITAELSMAKLDRAVYSNRQLEAVMEDFWFNHFNVFANKGADKWMLTSLCARHDSPARDGQVSRPADGDSEKPRDAFLSRQFSERRSRGVARWKLKRPCAGVTTVHALDCPGTFPGPTSNPPPGARRRPRSKKQERGLNENYGREVMELHTVGVDAGYTQQDVIEMAKSLTGWTIREPRRTPNTCSTTNSTRKVKKW